MKRLQFVLFIFLLCLIGAGFFFFANNWDEDGILREGGDQTVPALKLFNSHSSPQTGENWVVSFETKGKADLIITPKDQETIGDLEFVSLVCDSGKKTEISSPQILDGDIIQGEIVPSSAIAKDRSSITLRLQIIPDSINTSEYFFHATAGFFEGILRSKFKRAIAKICRGESIYLDVLDIKLDQKTCYYTLSIKKGD